MHIHHSSLHYARVLYNKNYIDKMCLQIIYLIFMYKQDLVLNNLQVLTCQKTQTNKRIMIS